MRLLRMTMRRTMVRNQRFRKTSLSSLGRAVCHRATTAVDIVASIEVPRIGTPRIGRRGTETQRVGIRKSLKIETPGTAIAQEDDD